MFSCFLKVSQDCHFITTSPGKHLLTAIWGGKQAYFFTCGSGFPLSFFSFSLELSIING